MPGWKNECKNAKGNTKAENSCINFAVDRMKINTGIANQKYGDINVWGLEGSPSLAENEIQLKRDQTIFKQVSSNQDPNCLQVTSIFREHASRTLEQMDGSQYSKQVSEGMTDIKVKLRGVLNSLINNEGSYVLSINRIIDMKHNQEFLKAIGKSTETLAVFEIAQEILDIHKTVNIGLAEEPRNIYEDGSVAKSLNFKDLKRKMQLLCSDMIKPVQRYPQLIMFMKDILKYTSHDHDAKTSLQDTLTGIETVAFKLNEQKRFLDQHRNGSQIARELPLLRLSDTTACLVRVDNMSKLCQEKLKHRHSFYRPNRPKPVTQRVMQRGSLYLMKDTIVMLDDKEREHIALKYMWHQRLDKLELTTSKHLLDSLAVKFSEGLFRKDPNDHTFDDAYRIVDEIKNIRHKVPIQNKLKNQAQVDDALADSEKMVHNKEYQLLQVFHDRCILLHDTNSQVTFTFWAPSVEVKQEWCVDFLLTKRALDPENSPCWYEQDLNGLTGAQTALHLKHVAIKPHAGHRERLLRLNVKCAICVKLPHGQHDQLEHLWICSSNVNSGHVSIVPMHSDDSTPIETFEVANCNIICVERVPYTNQRGTTGDSVWMTTSESEIMVFVFSASIPDAHRTPIHVFKPGRNVVTMTYIDEKVFCGTSDGHVLVYSKDGGGNWLSSIHIPLGVHSFVMSIISVDNSIWAGCGNKICLMDRITCAITEFQKMGDPDLHVQFLVRAGVGVWVSFYGRPNLVLFHSETKVRLQELSIDRALGEFLSSCTNDNVKTKTFEVTSLIATVGSLWIGTNVGSILTYPVTRLREGIPRINQRPQMARYGHSRPIRFLLPLRYDPVSGVSIREYPTSIELVGQGHKPELKQEETEDKVPQKTATYSHDLPVSQQIVGTQDFRPLNMPYSRTENTEDANQRSNNVESLQVPDGTDIDNFLCTSPEDTEFPENFTDVCISKGTIEHLYSSLTLSQSEVVSDMADGDSVLDMAEWDIVSDLADIQSVSDIATGESFCSGKTTSQCNTILVVSGGNGFIEWKTKFQTDFESQDPTLIFWIYKA